MAKAGAENENRMQPLNAALMWREADSCAWQRVKVTAPEITMMAVKAVKVGGAGHQHHERRRDDLNPTQKESHMNRHKQSKM